MKSKDWPQGRENLRVKERKEKVVEGKREKAKEKAGKKAVGKRKGSSSI